MNICGRARKKKVTMLLKKEQRELIKALEENGITASGKVADLKIAENYNMSKPKNKRKKGGRTLRCASVIVGVRADQGVTLAGLHCQWKKVCLWSHHQGDKLEVPTWRL